jgi:hypothetical protein
MAKLPITTKLKTESLIEDQELVEPPRSYFGISGIGHNCARALWYTFRWCTPRKLSPRVKRLLNRGHREEEVVVADLEAIGCRIHSQQKDMVAGQGHIKGHNDGIIENLPDAPKTSHLLEIKTANDKNFNAIKKDGITIAKPEYEAQAQGYMKLLKLKRTLFVVVNKNTDERYYERVSFDAKKATLLFDRALDIITSEVPPPQIGGSAFWSCKFCDHYDVCQFDLPPQQNCRTCEQCDLCDEGQWKCSRQKDLVLGYEAQQAGCKQYEMLKGLK